MHLMRSWDELTGVKPHTILLICLPLSFRGTTPCKSQLQLQLSAMSMMYTKVGRPGLSLSDRYIIILLDVMFFN